MTKAEEIYHRFVQYEWNEIGEGMKKSILDAINEALRQRKNIYEEGGIEAHRFGVATQLN
jgi:hypothetical protein